MHPVLSIHATCPSHLIPFHLIILIILCVCGVDIIKLLIVQFSLVPCYFIPLRPKYLSQHPTLKQPPMSEPTFIR